MAVLSAQTIRRLSRTDRWPRSFPLIDPFTERGVCNGMSYGLSACSYDCRVTQHLQLLPGTLTLASTIERFCFPADICGSVLDKSSLARCGISVFNTHLDPGWEGYLTVELTNLGPKTIILVPGAPICQIKFDWLDEPTEAPYIGKYQNQESCPVGVHYEDRTNER